jgi:hypothetical protein
VRAPLTIAISPGFNMISLQTPHSERIKIDHQTA